MRLRTLATRGWLGMLVAAAIAIATIAIPDTASAQRGGGGGGEKQGGGGQGGNRGGGGAEANRGGGGGNRGGGDANRGGGGGNRAGGENRGGGGAAVQSRGNASAQPKANINPGGGAAAQRGNASAQPRVNAAPRIDANAQPRVNAAPRVDANAQQRNAAQAPQNVRNAQAQQNARNAQAQQNARNAQAQQNARGQAQTRTFSRDSNARDNNAITRDNNTRNNDVRNNTRDNDARRQVANDANRRDQSNQAGRGNRNREPNLGAQFNQNNNRLTVNNVTKNSAAAQVGMRDGDQIVSVDGRNVTSQRDFQSSLGRYGNHRGNYRVPVVVRRNGNLQTLYWTNLALGLAFGGYGNGYGYGYGPYGYGGIGGGYYGSFYGPYRYGVGYRNGAYDNGYGYYNNNYDNGYSDSGQTIVQQDVPQPDPNAPFLGVVMDTRYGTAAVVRDVYSYSPADTAGLQPGDTITRINDQPISAPGDLSAAIVQLQPGSKVVLELTGPNPRTVEVALSTRAEAQGALEAAKPRLGEGEGLPPQDGNPPQLPQPSN